MRGGLKNEPALKTRRVVLLWCTNFDRSRKGGVSVRHVATSKRCSSGRQYTSLTQNVYKSMEQKLNAKDAAVMDVQT